jgi:hypothetical protein
LRLALVLRSGGDFQTGHARALVRQFDDRAPHLRSLLLTDRPVPGAACEPLRYEYPGWWAKMELFRPDVSGDLLYFDLDTIILDDLYPVVDAVVGTDTPVLLRDFYRDGKRKPEGLQSSAMWLPAAFRAAVWKDWSRDPAGHMRAHARGGDQTFLERLILGSARRWQDICPGAFVSWKVDCKEGVPPDARVLCFHGRPRPWTVAQFKELYT